MSSHPRRVIALVLAAGALLAALVLVGDVREVRDRLGGFRWWAFGAALGLAIGNYALRFARWQLYLRDREIRVPIGTSALVFVAGFAMAVTPGKLGELVKSYLLRQLAGIPVARSAAIVIAERVSDLLALLLLAAVGVAAYGIATEVAIATAVILAIAFVFLLWRRLGLATVDLVTRPRRLARLRRPLRETYDGLAALGRPTVLAWSTLLGAAAWACEGIGFALVVEAFPGAHVALGLAIFIYAATTIAGALSFLPGGLGVTEGAMTLLLVENAVNVDRGTATAATILTRLATLWFAVAIGMVALAWARRRAPVEVPDDSV
ncbi:MAG TPA: lysylphosphatidylglycerol synthase transmembrane domain-containing protein [Kofleriaceae bacterium]|nr:lysylphosphatidylglycerol synthase transmembrane domain-containing protein [Kofleriaceae bacterium]